MEKTIVIDASLTLAWVLKEKAEDPRVKQILKDIAIGKVITISPTIWLYETTNALRTAVLDKRIKAEKSKKYISKILDLAPQLFDFTPIVARTFEIATKNLLSVYDASYVALAEAKICNFYTLDEKLYQKLKDKFKLVKLASQYTTS